MEVDRLKNGHDWLNMVRHGSRVSRFHLYPTIKSQTVGQHTYGILGLLHYILGFGNVSAALNAATFAHDLSEGRNGDMPGNIKATTALGAAMKEADQAFEKEWGLEVTIKPWEYDLLKMCDSLECMLTIIEEMKMGNQMLNEIGDVLYQRLGDWASRPKDDIYVDRTGELNGVVDRAQALAFRACGAYRELRRFD